MFGYTCYGLRLRSCLPLPELGGEGAGRGAPDAVIREGAVELPERPAADFPFERGRYGEGTEEDALIVWRDTVACRIVGGREIIFERLRPLDDDALPPYLLGPALGVLLHQRGLLVLHASAVEVHSRAALFVGYKGAGKSTTAGALHARGHPLLADDVVALDLSDPERPVVLPGLPHQKLWPDAAEALGLDVEALPRVHAGFPKRSRRIEGAMPSEPVPVGGLYALYLGEEEALERLPARPAFAEVIQHTYAARFIGEAGIPPWHFRLSVALTQAVPAFRFQRVRSLERLPEALDLLEANLAAPTAA